MEYLREMLGLGSALVGFATVVLALKTGASRPRGLPDDGRIHPSLAASFKEALFQTMRQFTQFFTSEKPTDRRHQVSSPEFMVDTPEDRRARETMRLPALALLLVSILSVVQNLTLIGMYTSARAEKTLAEKTLEGDALERRMVAVATAMTVAAAAAGWGAINMLRLRGYWLSIASCVAIMPATASCCLAGLPIGLWSLLMLMRVEVSSQFRG